MADVFEILYVFLLPGHPIGVGLVILFFASGLLFFFLTLATHFGRSRWAFRALASTALTAAVCGLLCVMGQLTFYYHTRSLELSFEERSWYAALERSMSVAAWYGLVALILSGLAILRTVIGIFMEKEPGNAIE